MSAVAAMIETMPLELSRGSLRKDDVRQSALSGGSDDVIGRALIADLSGGEMSKDLDFEINHQQVFAAYDAHDVEGMLALCADGAQGRYLPYGKK